MLLSSHATAAAARHLDQAAAATVGMLSVVDDVEEGDVLAHDHLDQVAPGDASRLPLRLDRRDRLRRRRLLKLCAGRCCNRREEGGRRRRRTK
jgi:hypothetical protein